MKILKRFGLDVEYFKYLLNLKYNPTGPMDADENFLLVNSSQHLLPCLNTHGASLSIISDKSYLHDSLPRMDINDLLSLNIKQA